MNTRKVQAMLPVGLDDAINALCEQAAALGFPSPKADIIRELILLGLEPYRARLHAVAATLEAVEPRRPDVLGADGRVHRGRTAVKDNADEAPPTKAAKPTRTKKLTK